MSEDDYHELRLKQAELFVLQQIMIEFSRARGQDLYIKTSLPSDISDANSAFNLAFQDIGLKQLADKGLIQILNPNEILRIGVHIHIVDVVKLEAFYTELFESIPSVGHGARIVYSMETGKGKINGEVFGFKGSSRNRRAFEFLVQNPNKRITKHKLWSAVSKKGEYTGNDDEVLEFNDIITNLREALNSISREDLCLKKTVILKAEVTLQ